jgi:hypothetical protein
MNKQYALSVHIILLISLTAIYGCSSTGINSATATAQSRRASTLATHVATGLQATLNAETIQATATAQSLQNALQSARQWPVIISDIFDANLHGWPSGQDSDPALASVSWSMADGKYHWQAEAVDSFVWWGTPDMNSVSNFYLAVDARQVSGPDDGEYGIVFRQGGDSDYYVFEINNQGQFAVYLHQSDTWEAMVSWNVSPAIHPGATNRLETLAQGSQFLFYINNQLVMILDDTRLENGNAGLLIGLTNPKDKGTWEFDNFELRSK